MHGTRPYHLITEDRKPEFAERGYKGRYFFPHRVYFHTKPQPEQTLWARRQWGLDQHAQLFGLSLFAEQPAVDAFPQQVYLDKQVMIHRGHLGRPGLVASACLYIDGDRLYTDEHLADLVTRSKHTGEHGNRIRRRFGGWHHMLLNSILYFADTRSLKEVHLPTPARIYSHYIQRDIDLEVIDRLYDRDINLHYKAEQVGDRWVIGVQANRDKLVPMRRESEPTTQPERGACLLHDVTPASERHLEAVLEAEAALGIRSAYCVPANNIEALREPIERHGHELAFLSLDGRPYRQIAYDPRSGAAPEPTRSNKLRGLVKMKPTLDVPDLCRDLDFYLTGYRITDNDVAAGLTHEPLRMMHFDWVLDPRLDPASPPQCELGLVAFPITAASDSTHTATPGNTDWPQAMTQQVGNNPWASFALPLAHSDTWLPRLRELADKLRDIAELSTPQDYVDHYHLDRSV